MTLVRRSSPLGELVSLRQAMDRLFEDTFVRPRGRALGGADITVENGVLSIAAETRSERRGGTGEHLVQEIRRGRVCRTIALPTGIEPDKATASFEDGLLRLRIPKAEAVKPRQIRISPTTHQTSTNGSNAKQGPAAGETTSEPARAGA